MVSKKSGVQLAYPAKHAVKPQPSSALAGIIGWLLTHPMLDGLAARLVQRPRTLMAGTGFIGLLLIVYSLVPLMHAIAAPQTGVTLPEQSLPESGVRASSRSELEQDIIAVVASYNQASIASGLLGRADLLAPYLAPEGTAWQAVQTEYARRQARGETSDAALIRWGVLSMEMTDATAQVITQEQWDQVTSVGGQVISSRRGVLVRNTYELRRSSQAGWLIVAVETTTLVA